MGIIMIEKELIEYFDNINPPKELIERTITMSKNKEQRFKKMSKRTIAILVAAIIMVIGVTGYAAISRIIGDENGIVAINNDSGFVFDFSKADKKPKSYSDNTAALVLELNELGYNKVLLPKAMLVAPYDSVKATTPYLKQNGSMVKVKNAEGSFELQIFNDMSAEEMNGFYGTGNEKTVCEVYQINGIDVCLNMEGDDKVGYCAYIFYATDDVLYCINFFADMNQEAAHNKAVDFIKTLS